MTPSDPSEYAASLSRVLTSFDWRPVVTLADALAQAWAARGQVFLCGNGGSAANAIHLANDLIYGVGKDSGTGIRVTALSANPAVVTCLGNDLGYDAIFSHQLTVLGAPGDILLALSGSGNSPNIVRALETANGMGLQTFAILGYTGGRALALAGTPIHFAVDDMQIAEDLQMIVGHMLMKMLSAWDRSRPSVHAA